MVVVVCQICVAMFVAVVVVLALAEDKLVGVDGVVVGSLVLTSLLMNLTKNWRTIMLCSLSYVSQVLEMLEMDTFQTSRILIVQKALGC